MGREGVVVGDVRVAHFAGSWQLASCVRECLLSGR